MNHELTLAKINEKENPKSKIQTIKYYRIHTVKELKKKKKELVKMWEIIIQLIAYVLISQRNI